MKFMKQFGIILVISFLGEVLNKIIPLPIPASIYGLVIMFVCLLTGIVPIEKVREGANFLIEIMPMMFIPAAVGLMDSWEVLKPIWVQVSVITIISTILVMGISGKVTEFVLKRKKVK